MYTFIMHIWQPDPGINTAILPSRKTSVKLLFLKLKELILVLIPYISSFST